MLSIIVSISRGGITSRISRSIAANLTSVSSRRVPAGARACSRIWPESTLGKKSSPTSHTRPSEAIEIAMKAVRTRRAMPQGPIQQADVAEAEAFEQRVEQMVDAPEDALAAAASPCYPCRYKSTSDLRR